MRKLRKLIVCNWLHIHSPRSTVVYAPMEGLSKRCQYCRTDLFL